MLSRSFLAVGRRVLMQSTRTLASTNCGRLTVRGSRSLGRPEYARLFSTKTKGDEELSNFLSEEIQAEKKSRKQSIPPKIDGFEIKTENANVTLTRKFNDETITIDFNVNHTVETDDTDDTPEKEPSEASPMMSKPNFDVLIEKGGQKLMLSCTFGVEPQGDQDDYDDLFQIVEFSMYTGEELDDSDYSVSGDIMDAQLYDLLMNLLEERGVTNEFAEQLIDFSTSYEHGQYIGLLEKLKGFVLH
ncbi:complement component 1 Q subcomponent-binding protein, mitochondrial [Galendromus occidentalis]|uniref:Complement component 1 Q subcomponent-binding protein, mitochondrial n=1 Tax=Galendromus occidentalis TaxID=34638 RepID=A0AAJ6W061_9ACAR|nr:complement component 1 Q subcomponent-binding protein, mitochondrial [Galendromus occidentalis]